MTNKSRALGLSINDFTDLDLLIDDLDDFVTRINKRQDKGEGSKSIQHCVPFFMNEFFFTKYRLSIECVPSVDDYASAKETDRHMPFIN